jgi:predicted dehydrogenase
LREFGGEYATSDPMQILGDDEIDAVFICTWHDSHRPLATAAAHAGKHILLEKPLALTVDDARAIESAVQQAGVILMLGHKLRWAPVVRTVQELIPRPQFLMGQVMDHRWPDESWASQPDIGGANVLSQGCHIIDLLHALAGSDPVWVAGAGGSITHPDSPLVDQASALIRYENGVVATALMGDAGVNPVTSKFFAQVWDAEGRGACLYDRCRKAKLWGLDRDEIHAEDLSPEAREDPEGDHALFRAFIRAIQDRHPVPPGVVEGRITTETLQAVIQSIHTGESIALKASWRHKF